MCYHTCHAVQFYTQCKSLLSYICKPTMRCAKLGDTFSQVLQQLEVFFHRKTGHLGRIRTFPMFFFLSGKCRVARGTLDLLVSALAYLPTFLCTVHRNHVWDYIEGIVVIPMAWAVQCYLSPVMVFCIIVTVRTGQSPVQFSLMVPMRAFPFLYNQSTRFNEVNRLSKVRW